MTPASFPKTFGGLRTFVRQLVSYAVGADIASDPFISDKFLFDQTDAMATMTDTYERTVRLAIANGTFQYSIGTIYKPLEGNCWAKNAGGTLQPLAVRSRDWMAKWDTFNRKPISAQWQNAAAADPARIAIIERGNVVRIWPTPSITRAEGVHIHGYALPGTDWDVTSGDVLSGTTEASAFPLPSYCFGAVAFAAALDWTETLDPDAPNKGYLQARHQGWLILAVGKAGKTPDKATRSGAETKVI